MQGIHRLCFYAGLILFLFFLSACERNCPNDRKVLDVTPTGPLLTQGQSVSHIPVVLQYPTDCDMFPYRGTLELRIDQPDAIPGADLFFQDGNNRRTNWSNNGRTPSDGIDTAFVFVLFPPALSTESPKILLPAPTASL